ncbi:rhodanese-like domain-containing protein [Fodinibius sp. SL11]|uniref:rhodanese-like domain-containing protein n=1 Tax=Fodinibius sp. SL11 TaxID=3425690 RepID=UPI003F88313B
MDEITVQSLKEKIDAEQKNFLLLDVREPFEQYQSKIDIENAILIPVGELPNRIDELEEHKANEIVCLCRSGARSAQACELLQGKGFENVKNLKGGINKWAREIDDSLPVY